MALTAPRLRVAATAAIAVSLWLSSSAAAVPSFSSPLRISGPVTSLSLGIAPGGETALAWADTTPGPYYGGIPVTGIGAARRDSAAGRLSVQQLFRGSATYPHLAVSDQGSLVTFVAVPPGPAPPPAGSTHGYASWAPAHAPFGPLEPLPDGFGDGPVVFASNGDALLFASPIAGPGERTVMVARRSRSGEIAPPTVLASGNLSTPVVAAGGGKVEALWTLTDPRSTPNETIYATDVLDRDATRTQALSTPSTRPLADPSLAIDTAGDMVAVWEAGIGGTVPARSLAIATRRAGDGSWGKLLVPVRRRFAAMFPTVTISRSGRFAVVYNDGPRLATLIGAVGTTTISRQLIPHATVGVAVTQPAFFDGHGGLIVLDRLVADGHPLKAFYRAAAGRWLKRVIEPLGVNSDPAVGIDDRGNALVAVPRTTAHFQGQLDVVTCTCR
jgi:hypothetical protein